MRDEFYVVLPSNSSLNLFPQNSPTRFTTQLPQNFSLFGDWCVGLAEIQIPLAFQHISAENNEEEGVVCTTSSKRGNLLRPEGGGMEETFPRLKPGVYHDLQSLLTELNNLPGVKNHLHFKIQPGGYIKITCFSNIECTTNTHSFTLTDKLCKILGLERTVISCDGKKDIYIIGSRPASLVKGLPSALMIYSDICQPYITGDTHTPLLRAVPLHLREYTYGGSEIQNFSPPIYLPLLSSSFQTIEVYIKDEHGYPLSFDHGILTVTLHFKRCN